MEFFPKPRGHTRLTFQFILVPIAVKRYLLGLKPRTLEMRKGREEIYSPPAAPTLSLPSPRMKPKEAPN